MNEKFMQLTQQTDNESLAKMEVMRREMADNAQKVKLFTDLKSMHNQITECKAILSDSQEDKEIKEIASEEQTQVEQQIEEFSDEIIEAILPPSDADQRNCTLEVL